MLSNPFNLTRADILIVGEYPSKKELATGNTFAGTTGEYLKDALLRLNIDPSTIYYHPFYPKAPPYGNMLYDFNTKTNAKKKKIEEYDGTYPGSYTLQCRHAVIDLVRRVKPRLVISLGDVPLWALSGNTKPNESMPASAVTWNGSMLKVQNVNYMPLISPIIIQKMWSLNVYFQHALSKAMTLPASAWERPSYNVTTAPSFNKACATLEDIYAQLQTATEPMVIAADCETRAPLMTCFGLSWADDRAICLPFFTVQDDPNYWATPEQELYIAKLLRLILTHKNAFVGGQNWEYDRQYLAREFGFRARCDMDTMTWHHTSHPDLKKSLDILSFFYLDYYRYWKEDSKNWNPALGESQLWYYNGEDCINTRKLMKIFLKKALTSDPFYQFQMRMHEPVLDMTLRGVRCDMEEKKRMTEEVLAKMKEREEIFKFYFGYNISPTSKKPWWTSPQQTATIFYDWLGIQPVYAKRGKGKMTRTADDKALETIARREPLVRRLCQLLQEYRSLAVFHNTFLTMKLDHDNRIRCQYMIDGTKTFRFASMGDAFGFGTNLQNIPKGNE